VKFGTEEGTVPNFTPNGALSPLRGEKTSKSASELTKYRRLALRAMLPVKILECKVTPYQRKCNIYCQAQNKQLSPHKGLTHKTMCYQFAKVARSSLPMFRKTLQMRLSESKNRSNFFLLAIISSTCK